MAVPLRASFGEEVTGNGVFFMWLSLDIFCDIIYVTDAIAVQPRLCNEGCAGLNVKVGLQFRITVKKLIASSMLYLGVHNDDVIMFS